MNNITIRFHGITQKEKAHHLKDYLESLLRHAPSRSTCHLHIFKELRGYLCKLTVHSNIKTFSSHIKEETMESAVKAVLRNVKKQIAQWKNNRSSLELTGSDLPHRSESQYFGRGGKYGDRPSTI